ncbi:MAG: sugar ABC transporter permease [Chloroflexi bacterium]|nr:sugar ABC transporter permease [Chloroflexota bacterium]
MSGAKPRESWLSTTDRLAPLLMLAPATIFTLLMIGFPFVYAGYLSLHKLTLGSPTPPVFIGLDNFIKALDDPVFWTALRVNLFLYAVGLILELVLGTYIGILLGQQLRGVAIARVLAVFPAVIPSVAIGLVFVQMFDPAQGLFNFALRAFGQRPLAWLAAPNTVLQSILLVEVWQWTPFIALIVMGAMQTLPTEPYEAAVIDGASGFQILRYLTLPMLRPAIVVAAMLRTVDLMRIFDSVYIMTQGGPINSSMTLNVYAFTQGFLFSQFGYASAIMLVLLGLTVIASASLGALRRRSGV